MAGVRPLHLAFPVHDLVAARAFYGDLLGCPEGRCSDEWIDFDLYGHQIVAHIHPGARPYGSGPAAHHNPVDGHDVPVPHFGVLLRRPEWDALAGKLKGGGDALRDRTLCAVRGAGG